MNFLRNKGRHRPNLLPSSAITMFPSTAVRPDFLWPRLNDETGDGNCTPGLFQRSRSSVLMQLSGSFTQSTLAGGALGPGGSPGALGRSEPGSHQRTADIYLLGWWVGQCVYLIWVPVLSPRTRRWEPEPINTPITTLPNPSPWEQLGDRSGHDLGARSIWRARTPSLTHPLRL